MRDKKAIGCQFNIFFVLKVIILFYWLKKYKNINLSPINIITKKNSYKPKNQITSSNKFIDFVWEWWKSNFTIPIYNDVFLVYFLIYFFVITLLKFYLYFISPFDL